MFLILIILVLQPIFYITFIKIGYKMGKGEEITTPNIKNIIEKFEDKIEQKKNKKECDKAQEETEKIMEAIEKFDGPY